MMIDTVQLILLLVIVVLTVLLVVLGIQVFYILKDLRNTLSKANRVLDNAGSSSENVSVPIATFSTLVSGLKAGSILTVARLVRTFLSKDDDEDRRQR